LKKKAITIASEGVLPVFSFKFELPKNRSLNLPIGKHISIQENIKGQIVSRSYTPVTTNSVKGYFELVIKIYPQGAMGNFINSLNIGDSINIRGPKGLFTFEKGKYKHIGMLAGGTGITPMYQIIRHVFEELNDKETQITLLYGSLSEADIILRDEIDSIKFDNFKVYHVLNNPKPDWTQGRGFITKDIIKKNFPDPKDADNIVLLCGPGPMVNAMSKILTEIGYENKNYFTF